MKKGTGRGAGARTTARRAVFPRDSFISFALPGFIQHTTIDDHPMREWRGKKKGSAEA
jgi:hypothetical protein